MTFSRPSRRAARNAARPGRLPLAFALRTAACLALAAAATPAVHAQAAPSAAPLSFDIPAGPLDAALTHYARIARVNLSYDVALIKGASTRGLQGRYSAPDGLNRLLAGSGIEAAPQPDGGYVLRPAPRPPATGATTLPTVSVTGSAATDTVGFVAADTAVGTKTDTPIVDIPAAVSVVTRQEMDTRGVQNLQQAIAYTSSVAVDEYGADDRYDYFRIRGFDETTLGTYRDGLPARVPAWFTASRVEPYGLERVDVLKGSTSSLFGLNAPGGLVNAITKRPTDEPLAEIYTTQGAGHHEAGFDVGGPVDAAGKWKYRLTGMWQNADYGYDYTKDNRLYIAPALTYSPDANTTLTLLADYSKRESSTARSFPADVDLSLNKFLGEPSFHHFNTRQTDVGWLFEHRFGNGWTVRSNARYTHVDLDYADVYGATIDPTVDRTAFSVAGKSDRYTIDNQVQYDTRWKSIESKTLAGFDYTDDNTHENILLGTAPGIDIYHPVYTGRSSISLDPYVNWRVKQQALGIYGQEQLTYGPWILTLGVRQDHVNTKAIYYDTGTQDNDTASAFTKRIGLTYKWTEGLATYVNYSESFQPLVAPTANGYTVGGSLKPQDGTQYEAGIKYRPAGTDALFTASVFDLKQTNVPDAISETEQRQIGKVGVRGLELEGKFALAERLNASLAYSYWHGRILSDGIDGNTGKRPDHVPNHLASAWLDYTIPGDGWRGNLTVGAGVRYVGQTFGDSANEVSVGGHAVFDASAKYDINKRVSLQISATNLFDRKYKASCDTVSCYYGDPRAVYATLRYRM
ncbi:TonB-dependent siderophore receptor [Achromobacter aloeverae]